ncbi:MAG: M20 family metallopeptidase [Planctomycetota bacterium]
MTNTIELLQQLIRFPSVSSTSNRSIANEVSNRLEKLGFAVEQTCYVDENQVEKVNLVACRHPHSSANPDSSGHAYFCHLDVVPANGWTGPGGDPFDGVLQDDRLFGRGSCDMKGSLAAMIQAAESVKESEQLGPLWLVCTADEEIGFDGAKHLVNHSEAYREIVNHQPLAIIGEPTELSVVHAHKGIVGLQVISQGRAAHSSTRDGINANRAIVPMLQTLLEINEMSETDPAYHDERFDPPILSWNFGVSDGSTAVNITAERSVAWVSLRPMPTIDGEDLIERVRERAESLGLEFRRIEGGAPLWVEPDAACIQGMCQLAGGEPLTVCYGTDGGEFHELEHRVVFGPGSIAQAHTTDEWIALDQLSKGAEMFERILRTDWSHVH